jgi:hypothetical protein
MTKLKVGPIAVVSILQDQCLASSDGIGITALRRTYGLPEPKSGHTACPIKLG